ncbi:helix-turn-helix transcriptional regulator [Nitrospirillum sp. BR 11828]|uniref:helix-turn-helix transcriptional regulator n=1 Tax=Nitrospirillum sp. BR 11828 TaxID=3104325 RepID=UPI002ACA1335|nr:WYL domain-containing protein [Nitrospirillum sp. BR 11828]MDZ5648977.1 WYL domain-containing protein [Nitrospirillum sp. BR 11828]
MRASRLLSLLMLLQTRGRQTAQILAEELEVTVRTIYRDIDDLSAAGIPVYADRGREGGFQLMDGYRTRLTGMTAQEAESLFLAGLPGPAADLGLGDTLAAAQLKLLAALPEQGRQMAARLNARIHLDPVGWFQEPGKVDILPDIARAVWNEQVIRMRYERWTGIVERTVEPLGLVLKGGVWYLVARSRTETDQPDANTAPPAPRTYRISSILAHTVLERRFDRPADFDLPAHWQASLHSFEAGLYIGTARVKATATGLKLLRNLGPAFNERISASLQPASADGWAEADIPLESVEWTARQLLGLGLTVEVLGPPELRAHMAELAADLHRRYQTTPTAETERAPASPPVPPSDDDPPDQ